MLRSAADERHSPRGLGPHEDTTIARAQGGREAARRKPDDRRPAAQRHRRGWRGSARCGCRTSSRSRPIRHVHQMTSTVRAELAGGLAIDEIVAACFPAVRLPARPRSGRWRSSASSRRRRAASIAAPSAASRRDGSMRVQRRDPHADRLRRQPRRALDVGSGLVADFRADDEYARMPAQSPVPERQHRDSA